MKNPVYFFNTLTKQKEELKPITKGKVGMYNCGPTVYDRQHLGNLRSAVIWDTLRRILEFNGLEVNQVLNITDFGHLTSDADTGEDKMKKGLRREGLDLTLEAMQELGQKYTGVYIEDREKLNLLSPTHLPFASKHIKEDIDFIKILEEKGFAYKTDDGVYFDTNRLADYGKLGGLSEGSESRLIENKDKRNSKDFVLWKLNKEIGWESPWGKGFPGWHIECSVMSKIYLGEKFDIHTGGIEHIPIHHNNEIAQSEAANGELMANIWLHNEHLILRSGPNRSKSQGASKMAKSEGNVFYLKDVEERNISPIALKLLFLQSHYRSPLEFSWEALEASQTAYERLSDKVASINERTSEPNKDYVEEFTKAINDDMNTPKAVAVMWEALKDSLISEEERKATILEFDKVLGLGLDVLSPADIPEEIQDLADDREEARGNKDFDRADELRQEIEDSGFNIKDTKNGPIIRRL